MIRFPLPTTVQAGLAAFALAVLTACGGTTTPAPPPAPAITSFTAAPTAIVAGGGASLTAVFSNGTGTIDHGVGAVTSGTPVTVTPAAATTYTLSVTGAGSTVTRTVTVTVTPPAPAIASFTALPDLITPGGSASLTAVFENGTGTINNGVGAVTSGNPVTVSPAATTTYTLTVDNGNATATETVTVTVAPAGSATLNVTTISVVEGVTTRLYGPNGWTSPTLPNTLPGTVTTLTALDPGAYTVTVGNIPHGHNVLINGVLHTVTSATFSHSFTVVSGDNTLVVSVVPYF